METGISGLLLLSFRQRLLPFVVFGFERIYCPLVFHSVGDFVPFRDRSNCEEILSAVESNVSYEKNVAAFSFPIVADGDGRSRVRRTSEIKPRRLVNLVEAVDSLEGLDRITPFPPFHWRCQSYTPQPLFVCVSDLVRNETNHPFLYSLKGILVTFVPR